MEGFNTYKIRTKKGIVGDFATEWMTKEEREEFWKKHNEYVEELKAKGEYLQEEEITIYVKPNPIFDGTSKGSSLESYRLVFIDI